MNVAKIYEEIAVLEDMLSEAEGEDRAFIEGEIAAYRIVLNA